MAPQPPLVIIDPFAWERSTVTRLALNQLVTASQLVANEDGRPAEWIMPPGRDQAPNPPSGYVVSFVRFHERGFMAPASRFMRALCHHYGVELHNFAPNAISQAATFVGVCEGFLGIPVNWDLWIHLFRVELFTQLTTEQRTRRAVRAGGMSLALRGPRKDDYIPCTMMTNNAGWERGWFYLRNDEPGLPLHRPGAPGEARLLAPRGVPAPAPGAVGVASGRAEESGGPRADCGSRPRPPPPPADRPLMERPLRIFEMTEAVDLVALARSRTLQSPLLQEYAATRARSAIDPKSARNDGSLWDLEMLPTGRLVSGVLDFVLDFASSPSC
jgi:hypothetical protein